MLSKASSTVLNRRSSCGDTSLADSNDIHRVQKHQTFGLAGFTDDDLSALYRRRVPHTTASEPTTPQVDCPAARSMTPLEECDNESVISVAPTGLRAQQEILSALQKENFRLKLSLHSHRRKETLQNARLESASTALQDVETRKNGLEKTLKTLKGEIIAGYRNLEKLVSEQLESDRLVGKESCDRSNSSGSLKTEVKDSIVKGYTNDFQAHTGISTEPTIPRDLDIVDKQNTCPAQRSSEGVISKSKDTVRTSAPTAKPTRRHIIESPDDIQPPNTESIQISNGGTIRINHSASRSHTSSKPKPKPPTIEPPNTHPEENQDDITDPWIINVHLSNKRPTTNPNQQTLQHHAHITNPAAPNKNTSTPKPKTKTTNPISNPPKHLFQKILCGLPFPPLRISLPRASRHSSAYPGPCQVPFPSADTASASKEVRLFRTRKSKTRGTRRVVDSKQGRCLGSVKKAVSKRRVWKCRSGC